MFALVFQCFCFQQDHTTSYITTSTPTLFPCQQSSISSSEIYSENLTQGLEHYQAEFYCELGRVSSSYSFPVSAPTGFAKRYRLLLMCRLHKACDLMTFKSLKIRSLFLNLLPHPLLGLLSSLPSIYIPLPHIPKTIFCALYADFLLFSDFCVPSFLSFPGSLPHYPHVIQHSVFAIFWPSFV